MPVPNIMRHPFWLIAACALVLSMVAGNASGAKDAREQTVEVIGSGDIYGENIAAGRNQAVANSLVTAVSRVIEVLVPGDTIVSNFQAFNEVLYSHPNTFVRNYKVLTESVAGKSYRVLVQATISLDRLTEKLTELGIVLGDKKFPKLLLLITEQNIYDMVPRSSWSGNQAAGTTIADTNMAQRFSSKGFSILDYGIISEMTAAGAALSDQEARNIGKKAGAEVVLIGQVKADIASNTMGDDIKSYNATVIVRAIRTDNGLQIAQTRQTFATTGVDETQGASKAIEGAAGLAGEDLAGQIFASWMRSPAKSGNLELTVEGTGGNIANFVRFRGVLTEISGVKSIQLSEMMPDTAVIHVDYQGTSKALADALIKQNFVAFGINIFDISENGLKLRLTSN